MTGFHVDAVRSPPTASRHRELGLVVGGLTFGFARTFKLIDPEVKNPSTQHWERVQGVFTLLM